PPCLYGAAPTFGSLCASPRATAIRPGRVRFISSLDAGRMVCAMFVSAMHGGGGGGGGERHVFWDVEFSGNGRGVPRPILKSLRRTVVTTSSWSRTCRGATS